MIMDRVFYRHKVPFVIASPTHGPWRITARSTFIYTVVILIHALHSPQTYLRFSCHLQENLRYLAIYIRVYSSSSSSSSSSSFFFFGLWPLSEPDVSVWPTPFVGAVPYKQIVYLQTFDYIVEHMTFR